MAKGKILIAIVTVLYMSTSVQAYANDGAAVGALLGLFGAAVIGNMANQNQQRQRYGNAPRPQQYRQQQSPEVTAARAEIQRRLNLLGYDAGTPDGVYGPQSRRAIAAFQSDIGGYSDGKMTQNQIEILYNKTNSMAGSDQQQTADAPSQDNQAPNSQGYTAPNNPYTGPAQGYADPQPQVSQSQPVNPGSGSEAWEDPNQSAAGSPVSQQAPQSQVSASKPIDAGSATEAWEEPDNAPAQVAAAPAAPTKGWTTVVGGVVKSWVNQGSQSAQGTQAQASPSPSAAPATPQASAPQSNTNGTEAWEEPDAPQTSGTPVASDAPNTPTPSGTEVAQTSPSAAQADPDAAPADPNKAEAWTEPETPIAAPSTPDTSKPAINPVDGVLNTIADAVCKDDSSMFESVRSFIQANVVTKEQVAAQIRATYPKCAVIGFRNSLKLLVELEGKDKSYPVWHNGPAYSHGDSYVVTSFDHAALYQNRDENVLISGNYAQLNIMLNDYMSSRDQDPDSMRQILQNVNKRDCLGYPPLYYAAINENWDKIRTLIEQGANPNLIVPFAIYNVGFLVDAVDHDRPITDANSQYDKGYALKSKFACVDDGPSAALMNTYKDNNELVPLWVIIARHLSSYDHNDANAYFLSRILPMIPSVPKSTIQDLMDARWSINPNYSNHLGIVKGFVAKGADINLPTHDNGTPMKIWIAHQIQPDALQQLLAIGAKM